MSSEKLLEAIGEIRDEYVVEAMPAAFSMDSIVGDSDKDNNSDTNSKEKVISISSHKKHFKAWMKYAALAACFCICMIAILQLGSGIFSMGSAKSEAPAADCVMEESAAEEEAPAATEEAAPPDTERAETELSDDAVMEEVPAEEEAPEGGWMEEEAPAEDVPADDNSEGIHDVAYGIYFDDTLYFPISFQERKDYGLIDQNAAGLTPENTYKITEADLGEVIGTVEDCPGNPDMIGCTIYHFAKFPDDKNICIIDIYGTYEFYVAE